MGRRGGGRDFEGPGGEDRRGEGRRGGGRRERREDRLDRLDDRMDRMEERIERLEQHLESAIPCPNPQRVLEPENLTGEENTTNTFTTTTNLFRVNYASINAAPNSTATIRINYMTIGQEVAGAARTIDADENTSVFFNLPPGTYGLEIDIDPESAESETTYTVGVDQCSETTTTTTTPTTAPADESPGSAIS